GVWTGGAEYATPIHDRAGLRPGDRIAGPALIREPVATTMVEPGWTLTVDDGGALLLVDTGAPARVEPDPAVADPVQLELF
ncbi:hypothetical protein ACQ1Z2_16185, partial [Enterococcus faecalis]|uniref:hypothetical protein n=1 Tax=Enterococcus faecalis TaxID=1351 RepID=UPI003D6BFADD